MEARSTTLSCVNALDTALSQQRSLLENRGGPWHAARHLSLLAPRAKLAHDVARGDWVGHRVEQPRVDERQRERQEDEATHDDVRGRGVDAVVEGDEPRLGHELYARRGA